MSANAASWRTLTDVQRAGWESLGLEMSRTDSLGSTYTLNGFQAYCSVNNNLAVTSLAAVAAAPALATPDAIASATITLTNAAFSIAFTPTPLDADEYLLVFASPQVSAGRSFQSDMRLIFVGAEATTSPANVFSAYQAKFGTPVTGNKVFVTLFRTFGGFTSGPLLKSQVVA